MINFIKIALFSILITFLSCSSQQGIELLRYQPKLSQWQNPRQVLQGTFVNQQARLPSDGRSWDSAFKTISEAIEANEGGTIYVALGSYTETIDLSGKKNFHLIGGYSPSDVFVKEPKKSKDGPKTILDGSTLPYDENLILMNDGAENITIEGFVLQNMKQNSAIKIDGSTKTVKNIKITNSKFHKNSYLYTMPNVGQGAGIEILKAENIKIDNVDASENTVSNSGGFINANEVLGLSVDGGKWLKNHGLHGGALAIHNSSNVKISSVDVRGNIGQVSASGIFLSDCKDVAVLECLIVDNGNNRSGGAVRIFSSEGIRIEGSTFYFNRSKNSGGALFSTDATNIKIANTLFSRNEAVFSGGALMLNGTNGSIKLDDVLFYSNTAQRNGGAISINGSSAITKFEIINSHFKNNQASFGGAIDAQDVDYSIDFLNTPFEENTATTQGGALNLKSQDSKFAKFIIGPNVTFKNNRTTAQNGGGALAVSLDYDTIFVMGMDFGLVFKNQPKDIVSNTSGGRQQFLRFEFRVGGPSTVLPYYIDMGSLGIPLDGNSPLIYVVP